jgi:hypothetical protein
VKRFTRESDKVEGEQENRLALAVMLSKTEHRK